jgi:hypothetical protein
MEKYPDLTPQLRQERFQVAIIKELIELNNKIDKLIKMSTTSEPVKTTNTTKTKKPKTEQKKTVVKKPATTKKSTPKKKDEV